MLNVPRLAPLTAAPRLSCFAVPSPAPRGMPPSLVLTALISSRLIISELCTHRNRVKNRFRCKILRSFDCRRPLCRRLSGSRAWMLVGQSEVPISRRFWILIRRECLNFVRITNVLLKQFAAVFSQIELLIGYKRKIPPVNVIKFLFFGEKIEFNFQKSVFRHVFLFSFVQKIKIRSYNLHRKGISNFSFEIIKK